LYYVSVPLISKTVTTRKRN